MTLSVLIVDDQALVRAGFRMILDAEEDIEVAGEAADGADAVDEARRLQPDVVLMDVRMPNVDGIEATRRLVAADGVATKNESPCVSISCPPASSKAALSKRPWVDNTSAYRSRSFRSSTVEPSMSVKRKVRVPLGRSSIR